MIGRVLGGATVAVGQGLIVCAFCLAAGFRFSGLAAVPMALLFMGPLIAVLFTVPGTATASAMTDFQGFQLVMNFLVMPTFFLSGALFPLRDSPWALQVIARINPLAYGVDGLRAGALGGVADFHAATDVGAPGGRHGRLDVFWRIPFRTHRTVNPDDRRAASGPPYPPICFRAAATASSSQCSFSAWPLCPAIVVKRTSCRDMQRVEPLATVPRSSRGPSGSFHAVASRWPSNREAIGVPPSRRRHCR